MRITPAHPLALLAGLFLLVGVHATAEAECASPSSSWSVSGGQSLPTRATLFFFTPSWLGTPAEPSVRADGAKIDHSWKQASENEAFVTYKLSFDAGAAQTVTIEHDGLEQGYSITDWKAPVESVTGTMGQRAQSAWTCSHTDVVPVELTSLATAFRVQWIDQRNGVIDFGTGSSIFPRFEGNFWHDNGESSPHAAFELGHPNCFAYNVPAENLDFLHVMVTPLYRDGSEGEPVGLERAGASEAGASEAGASEEAASEEAASEEAMLAMTVPPVIDEVQLHRPETTASGWPSNRMILIALIAGSLFGLLVFGGRQGPNRLAPVVRIGAAISMSGSVLAWGASAVCYPWWLLFFAAVLLLVLLGARYAKKE